MPTTQIELTGISCHKAARIISEGVDQVRHLFSDGDALNYHCIVNEWNSTSGTIAFGEISFRPLEGLGFLAIYVLSVIMLLAALKFLHRKGASPRDVFYWGALALLVPFLGPLVVLIFYRFAARNNG